MSRAEKINIGITVIGLVLMAVPTWDVLEKRSLMTATLLVLTWLCGAALVAYSVHRNMKDAKRAESLRAQIVTIKDDFRLRISSLEDTSKSNLEALRQKHHAGMKEFKEDHAKNIEDARRVVIHSAMWGTGGPTDRDKTHELQLYLDMNDETLTANMGRFGDFFQGHPKMLKVEYSCPCSGKRHRHSFHEGEKIDFEKLCAGPVTLPQA
jgi:hypothetical protein